ncbi:hypothetical protein [Burkholderia sp. Ac-20353]|uniref:hypothetical protein n=1 Tax=Burkholderia sp. Ac-20353 TaxID=2703894 RepID=UPI00197B8420|nr:hypothetical protein [Burkholderia sp. Ac-20353]
MAKQRDAKAGEVSPHIYVDASVSSTISAVSYEGISITTPDGMPATLAVVDSNGKVIEAGPDVANAVWSVVIEAYRRFLMGTGHLRVYTDPSELPRNPDLSR